MGTNSLQSINCYHHKWSCNRTPYDEHLCMRKLNGITNCGLAHTHLNEQSSICGLRAYKCSRSWYIRQETQYRCGRCRLRSHNACARVPVLVIDVYIELIVELWVRIEIIPIRCWISVLVWNHLRHTSGTLSVLLWRSNVCMSCTLVL